MTHDLVIRGGTIVDGTGRDGFAGDVAIDGDRIVAVGRVDDSAHRTIDADGALVTPGFVDIHTHLDAQLAWDPDATSSCWHGVTSVVLGNCGVTFAPVRAGQESWLAALMESVEDIPAASILEGLAWDWETYGDYLSAIDRMAKGVNVGGMIGHCALRHYTMGERGLDETPATDDDIAAMVDLVDEAIGAGALGFSTSRTLLHRVPDGRPVPGTWADERELLAIADVLGRHGKGVYEVAPRFERPGAELRRHPHRDALDGGDQPAHRPAGHVRSRAEQRGSGAVPQDPRARRRGSGQRRRAATADDHSRHRPPVRFAAPHLLRPRAGVGRAPAAAARGAPRRARRSPDRRGRASCSAAEENTPLLDWRGVYVLTDHHVDYSADPQTSLAAHAQRAGESIAEAFVRISRETRGRALFNYPFLNQRMDAVEELLDHPRMAIGLGDSGAHVGLIMDASLPTWFLSYWVRDRGKYRVEDAVRRMTSDTAALFGESPTAAYSAPGALLPT